jgi:hypothetical protein
MDSANSDGREEQYQQMMDALANLERKYKGVRGQLLKKVREEFEQLKPQAGFARGPTKCSACGREMKMTGTDGRYRCMNGHVL